MTGWQVFWICLCIASCGPSMSGVVSAIGDVASAIRSLRDEVRLARIEKGGRL